MRLLHQGKSCAVSEETRSQKVEIKCESEVSGATSSLECRRSWGPEFVNTVVYLLAWPGQGLVRLGNLTHCKRSLARNSEKKKKKTEELSFQEIH